MNRLFQPDCGLIDSLPARQPFGLPVYVARLPPAPLSMFALSIQRRVDNFCFPIRPAPDDGEIFFPETLLLHQQSEFSCCSRRLRDQNKPARLAVEPIHNRDLTVIRNFEGEQFAQFFPKRGHSVRLGWMRQEKRRLIDDEIIVGFIDNCEVAMRFSVILLHAGANIDPKAVTVIPSASEGSPIG